MANRYTTEAQVRALDKLITEELFGPDEVDQAIADAGVEIDARLRRFYAPISEPHLFNDIEADTPTHPFVELIARDLAAASVLERWYSDRQSSEEDAATEQPRYRRYRARALARLKELIEGGLVLEGYGVTRQTSETAGLGDNVFTTNPQDLATLSGFPCGSLRNEVSKW